MGLLDPTTGANESPAASSRLSNTRRVRVFVYSFVALLLVAAIGSLEFWPVTGWRLYVEPRKPTHPSWELAALDAAGAEHAVSLYDLPIAYRNTDRQLGRTSDVPAARAESLCRLWAEAFRTRDEQVAGLRIYRTRIDARSGAPLTRRVIHACDAVPT